MSVTNKVAGRATPPTRYLADLLGLGWLVLMVLFFLSPALKDGPSFAPADLGAGLSPLTTGAVAEQSGCVALPGAPALTSCPHDNVNGDEITQAIPWNTTNYLLVHHGEFPLWNSLEGNGLPQFLNFESASLALPSLVGYAVPLSVSFLVEVAMKLLIAGFGTYWCCRLLGARPLAASLGGTTYMLSGSFAGWIGWPQTGTLCWAGFLLGGIIWAYRAPRRALPVTVLALSTAFAIYGGFVEAYVLLAGFFVVVLGVAAAYGALRDERIAPSGGGRIALGLGAGVALAAPLWLPGLSVLRASVRAGESDVARGLALHGTALLFAQGYDGLPVAGSVFFGAGLPNYFESAAYVGVVAIALAGLGLWEGRRRRAVVGIAAGLLGALVVAYRLPGHPAQRLVSAAGLGAIDVSRILPLVGFAAALLAAVGAEALLAGSGGKRVRRAFFISLGIVAAAVVVLGIDALHGLGATERALRQASLYWPVATIAVVGLAGALMLSPGGPGARTRRDLGTAFVGLLVVAQSAFLVFAGVGINSYARKDFPSTTLTAELARLVGSSLVALESGNASCFRSAPGNGYYPAMNVGYGVDELALHDPIEPADYLDSWPIPGVGQHRSATCGGVNLFAPDVTSAALARRYGAGFILAAPGQPAPSGTVEVAHLGASTLYLVPGATRFSFSGAGAGADRVVDFAPPGDAGYAVAVHTPRAATLVAKITASPGWRAAAGGRALPLRTTGGAFLAVSVPAGTTVVELTYRPPHLLAALVLALFGALALAGFALFCRRSRRAPAAAVVQEGTGARR